MYLVKCNDSIICYSLSTLALSLSLKCINQNSAEGGVAPARAKVTGATIRTWLLNKFISFLAVLSWKSNKKTRIISIQEFH